MEIKEAIEIMKTETECVRRNDGKNCDRDCGKCDLVKDTSEILEAYQTIISAAEKQIPKEPKRICKKYGKHKWKRKENGEIDDFAFEYGNHNGVVCEVCGESVCIHCNPDYEELEDCEEEYFLCPNCGEKHYANPAYCDCGQKLKWEE